MQNRKKRICLVVTSMLTVKCFMRPHLDAMCKLYDVTLIVNTSDMASAELALIQARVIDVKIERKISLWADILALFILVNIFFREKFDLVHSISPKAGLLAMVASWFTRVPKRVHTFQGEVWVTRKGIWRWILKTLDRLVAQLATHLLVVSFSEQQFLLDHSIIPQGKSTVLCSGSICGVDTDRFSPDSYERALIRSKFRINQNDILFLFLGRMNTDKGVLELAAAFKELAPHYPHIHLAFIGPDEENMRIRIEESHFPACTGRLHFSGFTDEPEKVISAADIICLPSHREGFGLVIIEAAAVGVPAIASRIYGITDALVENETGLLFEAGCVSDLVSKMEKLILHPELVTDFGVKAMERVKRNFSQQKVVSATMDFYATLLFD